MENNKSSFFSPQFIMGLMIIGVGIIFMLDNFDILYAGDIMRYWPAILVVYGVSKISQARNSSGQLFGWIITIIGSAMLLDRLDFINFRLHDWWPLILIIIGVNFLRGSWRRKNTLAEHPFTDTAVDSDSYIRNTAFMSGVKRIITSKEFRGGEISSMMGGCEIDLREAEMKDNEAHLDVNIIMGGVEIRVPLGWAVVVEATPIMGGVEDKTYTAKEGTPKRLILTGSIIMGGVEVKN
ncbi:MAG: LiaI-LiaF-like domain-containing protein [Bacteroidota bacterium]